MHYCKRYWVLLFVAFSLSFCTIGPILVDCACILYFAACDGISRLLKKLKGTNDLDLPG